MTYEEIRDFEIRRIHEKRVEDYIDTFDSQKDTVVLIPGAMGSQLDLSLAQAAGGPLAPSGFSPAWLGFGIVFDGDALRLAIDPNLHDAADRIVAPDGPLRFILQSLRPYDVTESTLAPKYNYLVFGFDWRRSLQESAEYLRYFLQLLQKRTLALRGVDPLPRTTVLCHSMGGLVAKVFLEQLAIDEGADAMGKWMSQLITVASPFYGTANHMPRYYEGLGVNLLDLLYGKKPLAQVMGGLPGPFALMHIDQASFAQYGGDLGLAEYPVTDADTGLPADPYDPANAGRWPTWVSQALLTEGAGYRALLGKPLPPAMQARTFHIRSGKNAAMLTRLTWKKLDAIAAFDPDSNSPSPVQFNPTEPTTSPGDGTVPFWSARLAGSPAGHVYALQVANDHSTLLEHGETLAVVQCLLSQGKLPGAAAPAAVPTATPQKATVQQARDFLNKVKAKQIQRTDAAASDPAVWRRILEDSTP